MDRRALTDVLDRLAFATEIVEGPTQRARAYASASRALWQLEGDLGQKVDDGSLTELRGVGPSILRIARIVKDGGIPEELAALEAQLPTTLSELRRISGLGPARIRALYVGLGIQSLGELEYACRENRLVQLEGFGPKLQQKVAEAIAEVRRADGLFHRHRAKALIEHVTEALRARGLAVPRVVGPYARGVELVDAVDLLFVEPYDARRTQAALGELGFANGRIDGVAVRVHEAPPSAQGCVELYLTASSEHWAKLVACGAPRVELMPEGLLRDGAPIAVDTPEALYAELGLEPIAPERREADEPLRSRGKPGPRLVTLRDLRGALHNHTVESDGNATALEMREAARALGLEYLGISDHSESAGYAGGLTAARLAAQRVLLASLGDEGPVLLTGVESDIREDGSLDYPDDVLAPLDVVIASVHRRHGQTRAQMTERLARAARYPRTDVIGHPTGRLLLGRAPSEVDMDAVLDACARSGCAVELNASPHRLDLAERHLSMAKERGVLVSIAADAHSTAELGNLEYGISIARRAGLTAEDVLNARTLDELRRWLAARRAR